MPTLSLSDEEDIGGIELGLDFAMIGRYHLPEFDNVKEAEDWAHDTKWVEPVFEMLFEKYVHLHNHVHDTRAEYYAAAINIMQMYKDRGIKGDNAMNAEPELPYFKSKGEAIKFANTAKWNEELLVRLKEYLHDLSEGAYDKHGGWMLTGQKTEGNIYYEQWQRIDLCVRIMGNWKSKGIHGDPAMGASCYAGSIPQ